MYRILLNPTKAVFSNMASVPEHIMTMSSRYICCSIFRNIASKTNISCFHSTYGFMVRYFTTLKPNSETN